MVKFIFLCMGVVALSFVTLGAQSLMDSMSDEQTSVLARNAEPSEDLSIVAEQATTENNETAQIEQSLNDINTAAGGADNEGFGSAFTDVAPQALADDVATPLTPNNTPTNPSF